MKKVLFFSVFAMLFSLNVFAQKDYVMGKQANFFFDSITIRVPWVHTQNSTLDQIPIRDVVKKYLYQTHDTVWLDLPDNYQPYVLELPFNTGGDVMLEIYLNLPDGSQKIKTILKDELVGKKMAICTNTRKFSYLVLRL